MHSHPPTSCRGCGFGLLCRSRLPQRIMQPHHMHHTLLVLSVASRPPPPSLSSLSIAHLSSLVGDAACPPAPTWLHAQDAGETLLRMLRHGGAGATERGHPAVPRAPSSERKERLPPINKRQGGLDVAPAQLVLLDAHNVCMGSAWCSVVERGKLPQHGKGGGGDQVRWWHGWGILAAIR